ncbi:MAG: alpha/beta hydrolase [Bdellovibrio sp.]|nr:alpha/beta hydrolase [Bdellovibrio sp.]
MTNFSWLCSKFLRLGALALLLTGCQSFFYYPQKEKFYDPNRIQLKYEDVHFKSALGDNIHAWYFPSSQKESKGTILFFHGNAENISTHFMMFYWLPSQGYNYLIFDYPGYGQSSGQPTSENTVAAGVAAAEWLKANREKRPLIIYGHSLGGIVAMKAAEELKGSLEIRNVIVEASFSSYQKMGRRVLSRSWITWLGQPLTYAVLSDKYSPEPISQIAPIPMLFIHGDQDPVMEVESSKEMFAAALEPKELWIVPGGHHGDLYQINNGELREKLLKYLQL